MLLALGLLVVAAPAATAGPIVSSAESCRDQQLDQTFLPWADIAQYTILPGGNLENTPRRWTLQGGAHVTAGNESFHVGSPHDTRSLALPKGGQVTTASICVGLGHPTMRFFLKRTGGDLASTMLVEVLFEDAAEHVHAVALTAMTAASDWQPTLPVPVVANLLPLLPDDMTAVQFRFTALDGSFGIDDVYVDPWRMR